MNILLPRPLPLPLPHSKNHEQNSTSPHPTMTTISLQPNLLILSFIFPFLVARPSLSLASPPCNQTCGNLAVAYPFGFSPTCSIPLSCTPNSQPKIGDFDVQNVTSDAIILSVPPNCTRPITASSQFFGPNFALTRRNAFLLRDCSSNSSAQCSVSGQVLSHQMDCPRNENITCFTNSSSSSAAEAGFFGREELRDDSGCKFLLSSASVENDNRSTSSKTNTTITVLVFEEVEIGWWVNGTCACSANAECTSVAEMGGYRCSCKAGFDGDGFNQGKGCWKVSACGNLSANCNNFKVGLLIGGIAGGASLTALIAVLLYLVCRRHSTRNRYKRTRRLLSQASFNVPFYSYKTIERATENFSEAHRIGTGAYGTVYVGRLGNGELIAIKKIKHPNPETIDQVINEVKIISAVNHQNLVRLLGCCIDRGEQILVYEFMSKGTLSQHLQRQRGPGLPWMIRLSIATQTAKALAYLHSAIDPPIYHRDIKSSNILLDDQFDAKIADFGLSRAVIVSEFSHVSTIPQGTPGYVDPQYHQNYHLSDKSDVYSFGVVLMEIITGLKVVDFNRAQSEVNLAALAVDRISKGRVAEIIDPFLKVQRDSWTLGSVHKVAELGFRCLAFHRDMRPSMMEVADELEQIRISCWVPKDGEVVVAVPADLMGSEGKNRRLLGVVSGRTEEEKAGSPVSVQEYSWTSGERSNQSSAGSMGSSTLLGSKSSE